MGLVKISEKTPTENLRQATSKDDPAEASCQHGLSINLLGFPHMERASLGPKVRNKVLHACRMFLAGPAHTQHKAGLPCLSLRTAGLSRPARLAD